MLELDEGKLSRPVLRRGGESNLASLAGDERQHREHRLHQHTVLPRAALTQFEIARIALGGMEASITQDNHPLFRFTPYFGDVLKALVYKVLSIKERQTLPYRWRAELPSRESCPCVHDIGPDAAAMVERLLPCPIVRRPGVMTRHAMPSA